MELSLLWFVGPFVVIYLSWLLWVFLTEGKEGIRKRLKREPQPVIADAPAAPKAAGPAVPARRHDARPGFRDVRWGDPPAPTMSLLQVEGDSELYMRADDMLRYGRARLLRMNYQFWRGRLAGIVMQVAPDNLDQALDELVREYGKFSQPKDNKSKYIWLGSGEKATQVIVDADLEKLSATVIMMSKTIADEKKAAGIASNAVLPAIAAAPAVPPPAPEGPAFARAGSAAIALGAPEEQEKPAEAADAAPAPHPPGEPPEAA